jgi:hypothetical protein
MTARPLTQRDVIRSGAENKFERCLGPMWIAELAAVH